MDSLTLEEIIMAVRRQSQGFSRGSSSYRCGWTGVDGQVWMGGCGWTGVDGWAGVDGQV